MNDIQKQAVKYPTTKDKHCKWFSFIFSLKFTKTKRFSLQNQHIHNYFQKKLWLFSVKSKYCSLKEKDLVLMLLVTFKVSHHTEKPVMTQGCHTWENKKDVNPCFCFQVFLCLYLLHFPQLWKWSWYVLASNSHLGHWKRFCSVPKTKYFFFLNWLCVLRLLKLTTSYLTIYL